MSDEPSLRAVIRAAKESGRTIHDAAGDCRVYELPAPPYDRRRGPSLVFETHDAVRVIRTFPAEWRALSDSDLLGLSKGT
jgi:hypothetical protein